MEDHHPPSIVRCTQSPDGRWYDCCPSPRAKALLDLVTVLRLFLLAPVVPAGLHARRTTPTPPAAESAAAFVGPASENVSAAPGGDAALMSAGQQLTQQQRARAERRALDAHIARLMEQLSAVVEVMKAAGLPGASSFPAQGGASALFSPRQHMQAARRGALSTRRRWRPAPSLG